VPDDGAPISYEVLERDTPVYSADGVTVGKVEVVRADLEADIFDGLEIDTRDGRRFVDADHVAAIREDRVDLELDAGDVASLPPPDPVPPAYRADPAADVVKTLSELLGRIAERFGTRDGWKRSGRD
jgi:hypothetical protein